MTWIPETCTLPTGQMPLRLEEFDALFSRWLREVTRPEPLRLRLGFAGGPDVEGEVRDLTARESACCSFFTFMVNAAPGGTVDVSVLVPAGYEGVLDGVARQATVAAGLESP